MPFSCPQESQALTIKIYGNPNNGGGGLVPKSSPALGTQWAVAHQALLSVGFPRQEYWSGLPFPPPGDLPDAGIKPKSLLASSALAGGFFMTVPFGKPYVLSLSVGSDSF